MDLVAHVGLSALILLSLPLVAGATAFTFTGDLRTDATVVDCGPGCTLGAGNTDGEYAQYAAVIRNFNVAELSQMSAISFSYGGGVNGAGATILEGGFQPYLSLFDGVGNLLASTYFVTTCPPGALVNTVSGQCYDVSLDGGLLAPGAYQIALTAYQNLSFAENFGAGIFADGFTGLGTLAFGEDLHYAFDVVLTSATPVPEPGTLGLLALGILLPIALKRRNRK